MLKRFNHSIIISLLVFAGIQSFGQGNVEIKPDIVNLFQNPPNSAQPWVFWYWMKAAVNSEGITADLEAMKESGIAGAYLVPILGAANPPLINPPVNTLTPEWWNMLKFAFQEADRLDLKFAMHSGDGFATAGGTWITPELSMQKVVWSEVTIQGNQIVNDTLPQPPFLKDYYRDIAVIAFPSIKGVGISTNTVIPKITTNKPDVNAQFLVVERNGEPFRSEDSCWIQYEFDKPFTCRSIITRGATYNYQSHRLRIATSNDGENFRFHCQLSPSRNGWLDWDADYTHSISPVTARYFRFYYNKEGSEPGSENNEMAKWKPGLKLKGLQLSSMPVIHHYEGKSGIAWRIAKPTPKKEVPDSLCVPLNQIVDLTQLYQKGKLQWNVPKGKWTILRVGYTTTGHENMTAGNGRGLECDKFNPEAAKLQFHNWYGEVRRKLGEQLTTKVLSSIHVDSWECGSQNWSPVFRDEFIKRRGYDPKMYLPVMAGIPVQSIAVSERFLYDIRKTISELVVDNFYGTLAKLAKENAYIFSAESLAPVMTSDGMMHYKNTDIPMGEFWINSPTHDKPTDVLESVSAAHVYGKNIIQAEAFTTLRMDWNENPAMLKPIGDLNFALGVNRFVFHVFCQNPWPDRKPGMTLGPTGLFFQPAQTWWKPARAWIRYIQRCQALLQIGRPVVDIAVFTGEEIPNRAILPERLISILPGILGKEAVDRETLRLKNTGTPVWEKPDGVVNSANTSNPVDWIDPLRGYKYDSFNPDALLNLALVKNGNIELPGGASYKILVIPGTSSMMPDSGLSKDVTERINQFSKQGAKIIRQYSFDTFDKLGIQRDIYFTDSAKCLIGGFAWMHREASDLDIYFLSNQQNSKRNITVSLRIAGRIPELWNPVTGETRIAGVWNIHKGRTELPLCLEANESVFIVLQQQTKNEISKNGANWIELNTIDTINRNWLVKFDSTYGGPKQPVLYKKLEDWSKHENPEIKYYSGTATFTNEFEWKADVEKRHVWLDLGKVAIIADVELNGISCGIAWTSPYRVEITRALKPGINRLKINVTNTWINRLIGDSFLPEDQRITWNANPYYKLDKKTLKEAGLLGPVVIIR